jgi:hypothetical protein
VRQKRIAHDRTPAAVDSRHVPDQAVEFRGLAGDLEGREMRKPSAETKNRRLVTLAKSKEQYVQALIRELRDRRRFGGMLANISFSLSQLTKDEHLKAVLDECRKAWDNIDKAVL